MTEFNSFGTKLQNLRKNNGLSQEELSDKLAVSRQAVSKWERGEVYPDTENLIAISKLFNVSLDELVNNYKTENLEENLTDQDTSIENKKELLSKKGKILLAFKKFPYPILVTVIYLLWGFLLDGWAVGWTLYVTIPVYYSIIECLHKKRLSNFSFSCLVTFVFLLCGMAWNLWHPYWLVFLTIPIYHSVASVIDKTKSKKI